MKRPDLLYALTTPAATKAMKATEATKTPVVFGPVFDPVRSGIVKKIAHPGGNVTGVQIRGSSQKALEWLLKVAPKVRRVFVPFETINVAAIQGLEDSKGRRAQDK